MHQLLLYFRSLLQSLFSFWSRPSGQWSILFDPSWHWISPFDSGTIISRKWHERKTQNHHLRHVKDRCQTNGNNLLKIQCKSTIYSVYSMVYQHFLWFKNCPYNGYLVDKMLNYLEITSKLLGPRILLPFKSIQRLAMCCGWNKISAFAFRHLETCYSVFTMHVPPPFLCKNIRRKRLCEWEGLRPESAL